MRVLIIGCGYVGIPLGKELALRGHEVFGLRRSTDARPELRSAGIAPVIADFTQAGELARCPRNFDWVVNTAASSKGGIDDYRRVYFEGTQCILNWLAAQPPKKYVYTSSTSVYGQTDGSEVSENFETRSDAPTSRILIETEKLLLDAAHTTRFPAVILRVAGIYGPGRGFYLSQFLSGQAVIRGSGEQFVNMIHRDDLVRIIIAALQSGRAGEVYNAVDDQPVSQVELNKWLAETLERPMPPFVSEVQDRKRAFTNKRVLNRKLKQELGYTFKYPTFREGFGAEIASL